MHTRASVFGWPTSIRSDDGLQFCEDFPRFCNKQGIRNELSAPYNPKSNGLAEAGVKSIKNILHECLSSGADPPTTCYTNGVMFPVWMASVPRNLCLVVANGLACPLPSQITPSILIRPPLRRILPMLARSWITTGWSFLFLLSALANPFSFKILNLHLGTYKAQLSLFAHIGFHM